MQGIFQIDAKPVPGVPNMVPGQAKFEGRCEDLKGHIYDCSDVRQSDIFAKTTKEIAGYVGRTYKYGSDAGIAVERLTLPTSFSQLFLIPS